MLPEADKHIAELQKLIDSSAQRLVTLSQQWEEHRAPLIVRYRELKSLNELRMVRLHCWHCSCNGDGLFMHTSFDERT